MDAKTFLKNIREADYMLDRHCESIEELRARASNTSKPMFTVAPTVSRDLDPLGKNIIKLTTLEQMLAKEWQQYMEAHFQALEVLDRVPDHIEYDLLYKHYFKGMSLSQLVMNTGYSVSYVKRKLASGIETVQQILDEMYPDG